MPARMKHISVAVKNPQHAAGALAELTRGTVQRFLPVEGGYACLWPDWNGQFVEFYPHQAVLVPTAMGADFQWLEEGPPFTSVHINLDTDLTGPEVKAIAARHGYACHFRPANGGPLHEVWIDGSLLIELVTKDLRSDL